MAARVMVGLSGGVDSSVTALLLREAGREVATLFMKNWEEDDASGACPAEADAEDARQVAAQLGLKFHARNFAAEYWDGVFAHFLAELEAGRTPNPDVLCNREVKFKTFVEHAQDLGYDRIATGHYARHAVDAEGRHLLQRGLDPDKDQSYFLHALTPAQLAVAEFPLGTLRKAEVRAIAAEAGLRTATKRDSTGICFIGERNFPQFVRQYLKAAPGPIRRVDDGLVVGEHQGVMLHTLGQRGGLGIGGRRDSTGQPWFVVGKALDTATLWVAQGDHPALYSRRLCATGATWIAGEAPASTLRCTAKIRYRQDDQACRVEIDARADIVQVEFDVPQRAATPGQSVVFYAGETCLGGAIIDRTDACFGGL